jgi:hypothetical protein
MGDDITAPMDRAITRLRADRSRPQHLTLIPNRVEDVMATLTVDGWVEIGVIVDSDWQHDWRVLLNVETGEGRLRKWGRG